MTTTNLVTCPRCSARLPGGASYCRRCGEMLRAPSRFAVAEPVARTPAAASAGPAVRGARPAKKKGVGFWWLVLLGYFGLRGYHAMQREWSPPPPKVIPVPAMPDFRTPAPPTWDAPIAPRATTSPAANSPRQR